MLEKRKKDERLRENTWVIARIPITINVEVVTKLHDHLIDMTLPDKDKKCGYCIKWHGPLYDFVGTKQKNTPWKSCHCN